MTIPPPLQEALRDSITSGTFVDTKFWVFSKRGSQSERIGTPKALFVNGHVARRVQRLGSLLDEGDSKRDLRARFPIDRKPYASRYDHENDSDLEEDDDEDIPDDEPAVDASQAATEKPKNNSDVVVLENPDGKSNESSDIISVSDLDSLLSESTAETEIPSSAHVGKVVVIEDVAFVTFQALLRYLYTDEFEFAPWGSAERRKARALEKTPESYGIPKPSPKSVYRLADKYDIPELKELALRQIQRDLSKCDIVEEVFSKYTSWYPELRELELKQLARALLTPDSGPTVGSLKAKIKSYTHGQLPHAGHILPTLYELMESDESVKETPVPAAAPHNQQVIGGDRDGLKEALTSSLTSGTFLDSQFYAVETRSSTSSPKIRPIYFCSRVGGSLASKLMAYSSKLRTREALPPRSADGYDSDIEDENPDPEGSKESYPSSKCVRECPTAVGSAIEPTLLLKSGAAKTWSAIFLCTYTGQITFATLDSQCAAPSEKEGQVSCSQEKLTLSQVLEGLSTPRSDAIVVEPCSPKSIYCLANKVGLTGLCDIAFKDIQSKLDENNIVQELFSPFTANHKCIREMEHELFQSKLKSSVEGALVPDIIRGSSSGLNSHRTAAMELIIERSIKGRRERMFTKVKKSLRPGPAKGAGEEPIIPIPEAKPPVLVPAPQPPQNSPEPVKKTKAASEDPPVNVRPNPSSEDTVPDLVCRSCGVKQLRKDLRSGIHCGWCLGPSAIMKCAGCGAYRIRDVAVCTCGRKFK